METTRCEHGTDRVWRDPSSKVPAPWCPACEDEGKGHGFHTGRCSWFLGEGISCDCGWAIALPSDRVMLMCDHGYEMRDGKALCSRCHSAAEERERIARMFETMGAGGPMTGHAAAKMVREAGGRDAE